VSSGSRIVSRLISGYGAVRVERQEPEGSRYQSVYNAGDFKELPDAALQMQPTNSAVDDGDRFDLDHRVEVGKMADLDCRAGRRCRAEIAHPHVGVLGELGVVGHVSIGLDDVGQGGADGFEAGFDVLADLLDLRADIALADDT
jgi:hypothetical protein